MALALALAAELNKGFGLSDTKTAAVLEEGFGLKAIRSGLAQAFARLTRKALVDTGAGISAVSKVLAQTLWLRLTSEGSRIRTLGATLEGAEYAASVSFPGTGLRPLVPIRLFSGDFSREPFSCIIGRDILQFWKITFDGPGRRISIAD